ncbi:MAG: DUF349 domain-containing protein [Candidatus Competibacter sp.]|nr:DUF349 domain-containing protein [Candidatus Competibacter sp.]MDG4584101.1 DUF349 domain-containing protein [Candidatus Competibacter sp.]
MILSRFLKPKWQHANSETRKQSLRDLDSSDPKLLDLARRDPDPAVRRAALERLDDLDLLRRIADEDADTSFRDAARARYHALLAGKVAGSPTLASRLERLRCDTDANLAEFLLQHAAELELRLAALERIDLEPVLADIAIRNSHPDLRLAALERVHDPELLDRIARQSRNRDKRLHRRARERLDALNADRARTLNLERLCVEMERLNWDGESGLNAGRFPKLEQEWREQEAGAPPEFQARYAQARSRFLAERQTSANRRAQRLELLATLESLLERLRQHGESNPELETAIRYAITEAPTAWAHHGPAQDSESRRQATRFQQLLQAIQEQERILRRNHSRATHLREMLEQGETLLQQPSEVRDIDLKRLRQHWEGLERPEPRALADELQGRFDGLLDKLRARQQRQTQHRDQEWQNTQSRVCQLETAVENGELQQAVQLQEQIHHLLKQNIGLNREQMAAIEERLQACAARIGELQGWRRWGASQAREQLCAAAENLIDLDADPADIAQRIQQVRAAWKDLDHHESGGAPKGLWKRFNAACERAYAPCQAHFEAQVRERQHNFDRKAALCEQLEQFETTTDWRQANWREADRLCRRAREQWRQIGPVNRADRKAIDRRFQQALRHLDAHLDVERERELQRRQQLIQQVQVLVENPDLRAAVETAKLAQAQWQPTVQGAYRQEQALWKAFRAACDAIFARRQAEQQAADAELQTHLKHKLGLCEEIESLALIEHEQRAQASARLQAAQHEWQIVGPVPRTEQRALDQRFEAAVRRFAQREKLLRQADIQEIIRRLQQRSQLCARLEAELETQRDDTVLPSTRQEWGALPDLPVALATALQRRFDAACEALTGAPDQAQAARARLEHTLKRKQIWCVCMEIVAGVDSPPEFAQLRMEYQVARLSASLAGGGVNTETLYDPRQLQEQWWLTGALPTQAAAELDTRFLHAARVWWQREEI